MDEGIKEIIDELTQELFRKRIVDGGGYGYLNCGEGCWKDSEEKVHLISDMSRKYIKNCIRRAEIDCEAVRAQTARSVQAIALTNSKKYNLTKDEIDEQAEVIVEEVVSVFTDKIEELRGEL